MLAAGQPEQPLQAVPQILVAVPVAEQKDEKVKHQSKKKHSKQWEKYGLRDFRFSEVNLAPFRSMTKKFKFWYIVMYIWIAKGAYAYVADIFIIQFLMKQKISEYRAVGGFWIASFLFSLYLLYREYKAARAIIASDDIADNFANKEAQRFQSWKRYDAFCFFRQLRDRCTLTDKLVMFMHFRMSDWRRLFLVETVQIILGFIVYLNLNVKYEAQCKGTVCEPSKFDLFSFGSKFIVIIGGVASLGISLLLYPCVRLKLRSKFDSGFSLREYTLLRVDKHINQLFGVVKDKKSKDSEAKREALKNSVLETSSTGKSGGGSLSAPSSPSSAAGAPLLAQLPPTSSSSVSFAPAAAGGAGGGVAALPQHAQASGPGAHPPAASSSSRSSSSYGVTGSRSSSQAVPELPVMAAIPGDSRA